MGVTTEVQERVDKAREHVDAAKEILLRILVDKPWGYEDLPKDREHEFWEIAAQLRDLREKLG